MRLSIFLRRAGAKKLRRAEPSALTRRNLTYYLMKLSLFHQMQAESSLLLSAHGIID